MEICGYFWIFREFLTGPDVAGVKTAKTKTFIVILILKVTLMALNRPDANHKEVVDRKTFFLYGSSIVNFERITPELQASWDRRKPRSRDRKM